jgi:tetratricopeptide (TPR) repeat protein
VAKYKKKRARELQHDRFRDATMSVFDRLGDVLEGKGRRILYTLAAIGLVVLAVVVGLRWTHRKSDEARRALGRAISIATTPVSSTASSDGSTPSFSSEQERAQKAVEEFQKVAAKYGDPYKSEASYLAATSMLSLDRTRAMKELAELSAKGGSETAILAKFALAQAKEADNNLDEAAQLYGELAKLGSSIITPDTANLHLALVLTKQGKKKEAADLLFNLVESSRKAKDADGSPLPQTAASREAARELQKIDPDRYAQLTPENPAGLSF